MNTSISEKPERMRCMEIWGGNRATSKDFEAPGIDIFVHSAPYGESRTGGGDVYYLTSCASGRISRFLLADVCGHGEAVSEIAVSLRDLLRANVNKISQEQFVTQMNREFAAVAKESTFATAVVATFFEPNKSLSISVAGHPYPLYYSAARQEWVHLAPSDIVVDLKNLPFGVHDESNYPGRKIQTSVGDMFLLYSDAFIESANVDGELLGIDGILSLLNEMDEVTPQDVIPYLRNRITDMASGNLSEDDATLILGRFTSTKARMQDTLMAPIRLFGSVSDNTQLGTDGE